MSVLWLILPLMLAVAGGAVGAFVWAARRGQLDDLDTPPLRMLGDDAAPRRARPAPDPRELCGAPQDVRERAAR